MALYSPEHAWVSQQDDGTALIGITHHAQDALGDLVYVELPAIGKTVLRNQAAGIVESVKSASDIVMPVDGEVLEFNQSVIDAPEKVNEDAENTWLFRVKLLDASQLDGLLSEADYRAQLD